ncbi:hypothetical protein N2152v2_001294 [Parachlorella kessleri]
MWAGDWALKRILKFVLKRSLRNVIKTRIDLDQLNVALGQGTLELKEVLLNERYLNEQLGDLPWEVTAAFVGSVAALIPLASLGADSCTVKLDEVFLTLRPKAPPTQLQPASAGTAGGTVFGAGAYGEAAAGTGPSPGAGLGLESTSVPPSAAASPAGAAGTAGGGLADWQGESAVTEGVKLIAGGLEALLQRLRVTASRVVIRLELPAACSSSSAGSGAGGSSRGSSSGDGGPGAAYHCHVVALGLAQAEYCGTGSGLEAGEMESSSGAPAAGSTGVAVQVSKSLRFTGLTIDLQPFASHLQQHSEAVKAESAGGSEGSAAPARLALDPCSLLSSPDGRAGCSGAVDVRLLWGLVPHSRPRVSVSAQLEPLQVHLRPGDVAALSLVAAAASQLQEGQGQVAASPVSGADGSAPGLDQQQQQPAILTGQDLQYRHPQYQQYQQQSAAVPAGSPRAGRLRQALLLEHQLLHPPGSRSLIEGLMLPDCEGLVVEALQQQQDNDAAAGAAAPGGGSSGRGVDGLGITGQRGMDALVNALSLMGFLMPRLHPNEELDEFFDAKSLLGSLQSSAASLFLSAHDSLAAGLAGGSSSSSGLGLYGGFGGFGGYGGGAGRQGPEGAPPSLEASLYQAHDLAASVRQLSAEEPLEWEVSLAAPSLSLALLYTPLASAHSPAAPCGTAPGPGAGITASPSSSRAVPPRSNSSSNNGAATSPASRSGSGSGGSPTMLSVASSYAPRLALELQGVSVSAACSAGTTLCALTLRQVEASEHLVLVPGEAAGLAGAAVDPPPEEAASVPCMLPPLGWSLRPFSCTAGSYPLPAAAGGGNLGPTLSQLSDLQASIYQSALQPSMFLEGPTAPRLLVQPVLSCASSSGRSGGGHAIGGHPAREGEAAAGEVCCLLHAALPALPGGGSDEQQPGQQQQHWPVPVPGQASQGSGLDLTLAVQPLTLWLSVPLLERLKSYCEQVEAGAAGLLTAAGTGAASAGAGAGTGPAVGTGSGAGREGVGVHGRQRAAEQRTSSGGGSNGRGPGAKAAVSAAIQEILVDLKEARADHPPSPKQKAAAARAPPQARAYLPHLCLVAAIPQAPHQPPAPTCHGYSYVALDMGMGKQPGAVVVRGLQRLGRAPELGEVAAFLDRLAPSHLAATPSLLLQQGASAQHAARHDLRSSSWGAAQQAEQQVWDCSMAANSATLYLVGGGDSGRNMDSGAAAGQGYMAGAASVLGLGRLFSHQVVTVRPPSSSGPGDMGDYAAGEPAEPQGLLVDARWRSGQAATSTLLQDSWQRLAVRLQPPQDASEEQGRWESDGLDLPTFRQQCIHTSPLYARLSAPDIQATLTTPALAALTNLADALLQLAPQPSLAEQPQVGSGGGNAAAGRSGSSGNGNGESRAVGSSPAAGGVQVAVEVECNISCQLFDRPPEDHPAAPLPSSGRYSSSTQPRSSGAGDGAAAAFTLGFQGVQLLSTSNLSGVSGGGALVVACEGLDVRSGAGAWLLHRPAGALVGGGHVAPAVEVVHVARPQGREEVVSLRRHPRTGRCFIPTDAQVAISLAVVEHVVALQDLTATMLRATPAGLTLATEEGDPSLSWLQRLGSVFDLASIAPSVANASPSSPPLGSGSPQHSQQRHRAHEQLGEEQQPDLQPQQQPMLLDWLVEVSDLALRYEPPQAALADQDQQPGFFESSKPSAQQDVAAVLVCGSSSCSGGIGRPSVPLSLRCMALHVAPAMDRVGHWSSASPCHIVGPHLAQAGYVCVATEGELSARIPAGGAGQEPGQPWHLQLQNHLLNVTLTQQGALLMQQLSRQLGPSPEQQAEQQAQQAGGCAGATSVQGSVAAQGMPGPAPQPAAAVLGVGDATLSWQAAPAVKHASGGGPAREPTCQPPEGSGGQAAADVSAAVQNSMYRTAPQQAADQRRQASVYIDGGWYEALENEPLSPAGSPPVLIDNFFDPKASPPRPAPTRREPETLATCPEEAPEGDGTWFCAPVVAENRATRDQGSSTTAPEHGLASDSHSPTLHQRVLGEVLPGLIRDDYLDRKQGSEPWARASLASRCTLGQLPPGYPEPSSRISLRDINVVVTLVSSSTLQASDGTAGQPAYRHELQLRAQQLGVQVDVFPQQESHAMRVVASLRRLDVRECKEQLHTHPAPAPNTTFSRRHQQAHRQHQRGGSWHGGSSRSNSNSPSSSVAGSGSMHSSPLLSPAVTSLRSSLDWRQVLGHHAALCPTFDADTCLAVVAVEAVRPDAQAAASCEVEYRVEVQLLALRLQLEQGTIAFLQRFFAPFVDSLEEPGVLVEHEDALTAPEDFENPEPAAMRSGGFIQRCEVQPFTVTIDYQPQRVDIAALRRGDLAEVLNLFPWGGVTLQFRHLRLFGVHDASTLGTALASAWLEDIVKYQVHKFLAGIAPIRSLCKVSSAAMQLISIPVEHLFAESSGPASQRSLSSLRDASFLRQMRRGLLGLARAIAAEALGLGASVAGSAQSVLNQRRSQAPAVMLQ